MANVPYGNHFYPTQASMPNMAYYHQPPPGMMHQMTYGQGMGFGGGAFPMSPAQGPRPGIATFPKLAPPLPLPAPIPMVEGGGLACQLCMKTGQGAGAESFVPSPALLSHAAAHAKEPADGVPVDLLTVYERCFPTHKVSVSQIAAIQSMSAEIATFHKANNSVMTVSSSLDYTKGSTKSHMSQVEQVHFPGYTRADSTRSLAKSPKRPRTTAAFSLPDPPPSPARVPPLHPPQVSTPARISRAGLSLNDTNLSLALDPTFGRDQTSTPIPRKKIPALTEMRKTPVKDKTPVKTRTPVKAKSPVKRKSAAERKAAKAAKEAAEEAARLQAASESEESVGSDDSVDAYDPNDSDEESDGRVVYGSDSDEAPPRPRKSKWASPNRARLRKGNRLGHTLQRLARGVNKGLKYPADLTRRVMSRMASYQEAKQPMKCEHTGTTEGEVCGRTLKFRSYWHPIAAILDHIFVHFHPFIYCALCRRKRFKASQLKSHFSKRHPEIRVPEYSYDLEAEAPALIKLLDSCIPSLTENTTPDKSVALVNEDDLPSLSEGEQREMTHMLDATVVEAPPPAATLHVPTLPPAIRTALDAVTGSIRGITAPLMKTFTKTEAGSRLELHVRMHMPTGKQNFHRCLPCRKPVPHISTHWAGVHKKRTMSGADYEDLRPGMEAEILGAIHTCFPVKIPARRNANKDATKPSMDPPRLDESTGFDISS